MPAVGALAAIDVVFLALMGVGLLYITRQLWVPFLIWLLSQIPVIGGWVGSQTGHWVDAAFNWIAQRISQLIHPLTDLVIRVTSRIRGFVQSVDAAIDAFNNAIHHLQWVVLPAIETNLIQYIASVEQRLGQLIASQIAALQRELAFGLAQVEAQTLGAVTRAVDAVNNLGGSLRDWVTALLATLTAWVGARLDQQWQQTQQVVSQASAVAAAGTAEAEAEIARGLADARGYTDQLVRDANGLAGTLAGDARAYADLVNGRTLATALAATGVVALSVDAIRAMKCIQNCNPLGQLGDDLQILDLGILLALLLGAASNPKEGAASLTAMLLPGSQAAGDELKSLFGG